MSTLKVAAINNPSASSGGLAISAGGNVSGAGMDLIVKQDFSAVSSVSVNNCFSSSYENYRIVASITTTSANVWQAIRWRASGVDSAGANYNFQQNQMFATTFQGARFAGNTAGRITFSDGAVGAGGPGAFAVLDVFQPQLAQPTFYSCLAVYRAAGATAIESVFITQHHAQSVAYDGFTLLPESGNMTGTVRVYGYRNA